MDLILRRCRQKWAIGEEPVITVNDLKQNILDDLKNKLNLEPDINWSNYKRKVLDEKARRKIESIERTFDDYTHFLCDSGFIMIKNDRITELLPWKDLTDNLLSKEEMPRTQAQKIIAGFFSGDPTDMLQMLKNIGLIALDETVVRSKLVEVRGFILDKVLTCIEEKDSTQIKYGIYNTSTRGLDLFSEFRLPSDPFFAKLEYGIRELKREKLILSLEIDEDIRNWQFRSRIAEIVRLLSKLRQRFNWHRSYRNSPRLTRSVKFEVVRKNVPNRYIDIKQPLSTIEESIKASTSWNRYRNQWATVLPIFLETMHRRGFHLLADFQSRCFEKIFTHLANPLTPNKGLVISAGTGTGKTLSFFGPLLLYSMLEKAAGGSKGVKALCVYPRIKLAENQLESFIKSLHEVNSHVNFKEKLTIGIDYTGTPWNRQTFTNDPIKGTLFEGKMRRLWRYSKRLDAYVCPYAKCPECGNDLVLSRKADFSTYVPLECSSSNCNVEIDFVIYCKEDLKKSPPDLFVTTTESLHRRLFDNGFQSIFGTDDFVYPKLIMIDEIHLHTSLRGTQVALLLRRLIQRLNLGADALDQTLGKPIVLGLSATIVHQKEFFNGLTGIREHLIEVEGPLEDDALEETGVEYFLFVKPEIGENVAVLSNLIQTCMCVLHNMPQPEGFPSLNYKTLGFVDSLDIVQRWQGDLHDAEQNLRLYQLRDPSLISRDSDLRNYFPVEAKTCGHCRSIPNKNCILFREGECWWFMRYGNSQANPLRVHLKTSARGFVPESYDLVVTTSAMEVGYDDPDLMCIVQYQSPMNVASFTQRKGRGGRKLRDRPITIAVLSPYKTRDVYYYRNNHVLIEPFLEKLPLNPENKMIKRIHGFYAVLDYLAFERKGEETDFPARISAKNASDLGEVLERRRRRNIYRYLKKVFNYSIEDSEIEEIFQLIRKLKEKAGNYPLYPWSILPEELPANLFTDVNLPSVGIYEYNVYDGDEEWRKSWDDCSLYPNPHYPEGFKDLLVRGYCHPKNRMVCHRNCRPKELERDVNVNLALSEASLVNVTFRWGDMAYWIPPFSLGSEGNVSLKQMDVKYNWLKTSASQEVSIKGRLVPRTLLDIVPEVRDGKQKEILIHRPDAIREAKFLDPTFGDISHWIYCFDCDQVFAGANQFNQLCEQPEKHLHDSVSERTTGYPLTFYHASFARDDLVRGVFKREDLSQFQVGRWFGPFGPLFTGLFFANKDTDEYLKISKVTIGSNCQIKTRRGLATERVYGFIKDSLNAGLGYSMETDGVDFWLDKKILDFSLLKKEMPQLYNTLKSNIFKFEMMIQSKKPGGKNTFAVNNFINAYLTLIASIKNPNPVFQYVDNGCSDLNLKRRFNETVDRFYVLNEKSKRNVMELFEDPDFMRTVVQKHRDILLEEKMKLINNYLSDIFQHSLKHTLKNATTVLAGFESERDIGGWTYLNFDFDLPQRNHVYVFEYGMYGTGAIRGLYQKFEDNPQTLWNILEDYILFCPTSQEEHFLIEVLSLDDPSLEGLESIINKIFESGSSKEKNEIIESLHAFFRKKYSYEIGEEDVRALVRVFSKPLELEGTEIKNWKLYKELNIALCNFVTSVLGRDPNIEEVQQAVFDHVVSAKNELMPTWVHFFGILQKESVTGQKLIEDRIRSDLKKFPALKTYLERVTDLSEVEKMYGLAEEEQLESIARKLGYDKSKPRLRRQIKKLIDTLFEPIEETPLYELYFRISRNQTYKPEKLLAALTKRRLKEEIEKRLLNTCVDSCPSCLETPCEVDFILRSKLLLSRRLLGYVMGEIKEGNSIHAEDFSDPNSLENEISKRLQQKYQTYLVYDLGKSNLVSQALSKLLGTTLRQGDKTFRVTVNSSGYREVSFKKNIVKYEVGLRCLEVTR